MSLEQFISVELHSAISRFHRLEEARTPEARSIGIEYATTTGRRLGGRSATAPDTLFGEKVIDDALHEVREKGVGRRETSGSCLSQEFPEICRLPQSSRKDL